MWRILMLAVFALGLAAPAHSAERPAVVRHPDWLRRPSGADFARYYPRRALLRGESGHAVIRCAVQTNGTLANCVVRSESPQGEGFGQAALQMSGAFRMTPMMRDGVPVSGGTVNIPIHFNVGRPSPFFHRPGWLEWALLAAIGVIAVMGMALNDAMRGARGAPTAPVWRAYASGLLFVARSWIAYPAPLVLMTALAGLAGWLGGDIATPSPVLILAGLAALLVAAAGYRFGLGRLDPGDRALRLGPLGLQFGETEARTFVCGLLVGVFWLAPVIVLALVGIVLVAVLALLLHVSAAVGNAVTTAFALAVAVVVLWVVARTFLITPHIVLRKETELVAPWRATRAAVFSALAVSLLWLATVAAAGAGVIAGFSLWPAPMAHEARWAAAAAQALAAGIATPLYVGIQVFFYRCLLDLTAPPPARTPTVQGSTLS